MGFSAELAEQSALRHQPGAKAGTRTEAPRSAGGAPASTWPTPPPATEGSRPRPTTKRALPGGIVTNPWRRFTPASPMRPRLDVACPVWDGN